MKNSKIYFGVFIFLFAFHSPKGFSQKGISAGRDIPFDMDWKFKKGYQIDAQSPSYSDADWRKLDLPHDWSIEDLSDISSDSMIGPFSKKAPGKQNVAFTVGGTAWYRKTFKLDKSTLGKKVFIQFDGVYMNADVWINGYHLGNHPNGYTSFIYDLSQHLNPIGKANTIAVQVKNEGSNSRWYSGSGIYRHVWLHIVNSTHIANWGVQLVSSKVSEQSASIHISTSLESNTENLTLLTELYSGENKLVGSNLSDVASQNKVEQVIVLKSPDLWSIENPQLYQAKVTLKQNGKIIDQYKQTFGIRSIHFDAQQGFTLNGKSVKIKGGCIHHDNGPLGAAAINRAEERKIELLKQNGYNAVRFSHNPYSPYLLDVCDRLGLLVMNEFFDMWNEPKSPDDYANYFADWGEKDIRATINRDFNHPSIIMWSIGNEIPEIIDTLGYETSAKLARLVKSLDTTRATTTAIPFFIPYSKQKKWETTDPAFATVDVGGYNYAYSLYENDHKRVPDRVVVATEYFANKALENWNAVEKHPYVIGMFSWAAIDYLGEAGIGLARLKHKDEKFDFSKDFTAPLWPVFGSYTGELDLIGLKKSASYYLDVVWRRSPLEMVVHRPIPKNMKEDPGYWGFPDEMKSWTWTGHENDTVQVRVFTRSQKIRLELNGVTIGEQSVPNNSITTTFKVPFVKGNLVARCFDNDKEIASQTLSTAGTPFSIRLTADRSIIKASKNDLAFITVEVVDKAGNVIPDEDDRMIKFQISGKGSIAGVANANPRDMSSFQKPEKKVFQGRNLIVIKPTHKAGSIKVIAQAEGLGSGVITINSIKD